MTQGIQDLIKAIDSGDSQAIDAAFNTEMASRISTRLEDTRISVAQGMFATEQATCEACGMMPCGCEESVEEIEVEVQDTADTPVEEPAAE